MADYARFDTLQHPFLTVPKLYISQLPSDVTDADVARALESCVPLRPQMHLDPETNTMRGTSSDSCGYDSF
jgi:polyadenylate-binding protein